MKHAVGCVDLKCGKDNYALFLNQGGVNFQKLVKGNLMMNKFSKKENNYFYAE